MHVPAVVALPALVAYLTDLLESAVLFITVIPNKYIPLQNVIIGLISAFVCYFTKIETDLLQAIVLCLISTMGAGGIADLIKIGKGE